MRYPVLYEHLDRTGVTAIPSTAVSGNSVVGTTTTISGTGIGVLADALSCVVTESRNGSYELEMLYPINGKHFDDIEKWQLITAKPNPYDDAQPFEIYEITKPHNGICTVRAQHISYKLGRIPVTPFSATTAAGALSGLSTHSAIANTFTFWTDKSTAANFTLSAPASCRAVLGGTSGSILDTFGGEWEFDGFTCKLHNNRGSDSGVTIRYGKNLSDLKQEESIAACYAGVMPFWKDSQSDYTKMIDSTDNIVWIADAPTGLGVYVLDCSQDFKEEPTDAQLISAATSYAASNNLATPRVSLSVSFVDLAGTAQYADLTRLETVKLCDTVTVYYEELGVNATAKVIKTVYDCMADRYKSVELGNARNSLSATIASISAIPEELQTTKSKLELAIENATNQISGNAGGYVVMHDSNADGEPDEILIMDTNDISTANKVWRWNKSGLGYSSTGYDGSYALAMTQDGKIVADFITTGTLDCTEIDVTHLHANEVDIEGNLASENGDYKSTMWSAVNSIFWKNRLRASLYCSAPSDGQNTGVLHLYSGDNRDSATTHKYAGFSASEVNVGTTDDGKHTGTINALKYGNTDDAFVRVLSGNVENATGGFAFESNDKENLVYGDWVILGYQYKDGEWYAHSNPAYECTGKLWCRDIDAHGTAKIGQITTDGIVATALNSHDIHTAQVLDKYGTEKTVWCW